ncbi:zinc finger protein 91-like [Toxorhynchites rutilus septentrionalis]|uniref:zinc finger protein 91-like n=1 Tax=Toxorhynchites rutilus septentrionalis TaxID=329112 RepID=UPI002479CD88|nr:zinc finger protein 91-like [Toxorhynchites rutilus septentrionalis]
MFICTLCFSSNNVIFLVVINREQLLMMISATTECASFDKSECKEHLDKIRFYIANYTQLCRLCLSNDRLVNLYSNVQGKDVSKVRHFIKESLRMLEQTIDEKDRLPHFICKKCERILNTIFNFKKQCEDSRRILEKVRDKTIAPDDLRNSDHSQAERNELQSWVETDNVGTDCEENPKELPRSINLENVEENTRVEKPCEGTDAVKPDSDETKQEVCDLGSLLLGTESNIEQNDIINLAEEDQTVIHEKIEETARVEERCVETNAKLNEIEREGVSELGFLNDFTNMIEENTGKQPENHDELLEEKYPNENLRPDILKQTNDVVHTKTVRSNREARKEQKTRGKKTDSRDRFKKIPEKKQKCPVCGVLVNNIKYHMIYHEKVRPHQCKNCPKSFATRDKLQSHVNSVHLKKRDYKCKFCDKAYLERNNLKRHLRFHEGDPQYKCDLCPEAFRFAEQLRSHKLVTHTRGETHECHVCGKIFPLRTTLNKHIKLHNKEKPHKCDFCEKTFHVSHWKIAHMRIHTGEKPVLCRICGIGFPSHKGRSLHMQKKHANELISKKKHIVSDCLSKSEHSRAKRVSKHHRIKLKNIGPNCEDVPEKQAQSINDGKVQETSNMEKKCDEIDAVKEKSNEIKQEVCDLGFLFLGTEHNIEQNDNTILVEEYYAVEQEDLTENHDEFEETARVEEPCAETDAVEKEADEIEQGDEYSDEDWSPDKLRKKRSTRGNGTASKDCYKTIPKGKAKCPICGSLVSNIRAHLIYHEKVRPHQCTECPKNFANRSKLQLHINSVHLQKRDWKCEFCDKAYLERNNLKRHRRSAHKNVFCVRNFIKESLRMLGQTINEEDRLPNFICEKCERNLNIIFNFKKQCEDSRRILEKVRDKTIAPDDLRKSDHSQAEVNDLQSWEETNNVGSFYEESSKKSITVEKVEGNVRVEKPCEGTDIIEPYSNEIKQEDCGSGFLFVKTEYNIEQNDITNLVEKKCTVNQEDFTENRDKFEQTVRVEESFVETVAVKTEPNEIEQEMSDLGMLFLGTEYNIEQNDATNLFEESYTVKQEEFLEDKCSDVEWSPDKLKQTNYVVCGTMFLLESTLNKHLKLHNNDRPHKCEFCEKTFRLASCKVIHMRTHTGEKPLLCRICGIGFAHHKARSTHMETEHAEELIAKKKARCRMKSKNVETNCEEFSKKLPQSINVGKVQATSKMEETCEGIGAGQAGSDEIIQEVADLGVLGVLRTEHSIENNDITNPTKEDYSVKLEHLTENKESLKDECPDEDWNRDKLKQTNDLLCADLVMVSATTEYTSLDESECKEELDRIRFYIANYKQLCRLCLTNERLVNLYSNVHGRNVFYVRNFIKESLRVLEQTIDKKDRLPNFICEKCERNLNIIFNFKKKCEDSRRILEKVRDKTIVPEDLRKLDHGQTDRIASHNWGRTKMVESNCEKILKKLPQSINVEKVKETTKEEEPCNRTNAVKAESDELKQEVSDLGSLFPGTEFNLELNDITNLVEENRTAKEEDVTEHHESGEELLEDKDSDEDWCPDKSKQTNDEVCSETEKSAIEAKKERRKRGKKNTVLKDRSRKLAKEKTICPICGALVNNIKCHMVIHEEVRPHQCAECPKNFTSRNKLQSHINSVHLKKRDYKCEICGKAFLEKNNLKGHLRIHKGDRKYKCDLCPKTFLFAGTLRCHKLTHTQDKKHECQVCGKMFLMRTTLNKHLHVHSNERPHKCDICDKAFRTSTHKIIHMRTHTGEKPLQCRICGIGFAHHKARSVHMKTKHAEELIAMDMLDERGYLKF